MPNRFSVLVRSRAVFAIIMVSAACAVPATQAVPASNATQISRPERGAFVVHLGTDTVAVEQFTRTADRIEGRQIVRSPRTTIRDYVATLGADGTVSRFEVSFQRPGEAAPYVRGEIDFGADSAQVRIQQGDSTRTLRVAAPRGTVPSLGNSFALYEQAAMQARREGRDSVPIPALAVGAPAAGSITFRRLGSDSMIVTNIAGASRARVDEGGRLLGWDGRGSTIQVLVERTPAIDIDALAASFAARDQQGRALGVLSPMDSARATIDGASIEVVYGRPYKRGRVIFGGVVPWDQVWRTGANSATEFRTDRDLRMNGVTVPAGSYTLWTIPSPAGWKLIINKQTGQFGTEHDASQDLARIDMTRETPAQPIEQFTISIEPQGAGGVLKMGWDDTQVSVPFTVQ
jgi:hypothetical protein